MQFVKEQLLANCAMPTTILSGRTAIVTGANVGLGYETVVHLAKLDARRLIIACRNLQKGEAAKLKLLAAVPEFKGEVEIWELDLSKFSSVKAFAARISAMDRLDIFVENAGVATERWEVTEDGYESTLQINDISTGMLGVLALPTLAKTAKLPPTEGTAPFKPHLAIVGSEVHFWAQFPQQKTTGSILAALNDKAQHAASDRYNVSKLLNLFLAREIAALPAAKDVVVNVINPGLCVSELRNEMNGVMQWVLNSLARTGEHGARNIAWAATEETSPGAYVSASSEKSPSAYSTSEQGLKMQRKVWDEMKALWTKESPEIATILA